MPTVKGHRILIVVTAVLVVLLIAGCGSGTELANAGSPTSPPPTVDLTTAPEEPTAPVVGATVEPATTVQPATTNEPGVTVQPVKTNESGVTVEPVTTDKPPTAPVPTPDLTSIEALLSGIDGDLGDDAGAAASEGSPQ